MGQGAHPIQAARRQLNQYYDVQGEYGEASQSRRGRGGYHNHRKSSTEPILDHPTLCIMDYPPPSQRPVVWFSHPRIPLHKPSIEIETERVYAFAKEQSKFHKMDILVFYCQSCGSWHYMTMKEWLQRRHLSLIREPADISEALRHRAVSTQAEGTVTDWVMRTLEQRLAVIIHYTPPLVPAKITILDLPLVTSPLIQTRRYVATNIYSPRQQSPVPSTPPTPLAAHPELPVGGYIVPGLLDGPRPAHPLNILAVIGINPNYGCTETPSVGWSISYGSDHRQPRAKDSNRLALDAEDLTVRLLFLAEKQRQVSMLDSRGQLGRWMMGDIGMARLGTGEDAMQTTRGYASLREIARAEEIQSDAAFDLPVDHSITSSPKLFTPVIEMRAGRPVFSGAHGDANLSHADQATSDCPREYHDQPPGAIMPELDLPPTRSTRLLGTLRPHIEGSGRLRTGNARTARSVAQDIAGLVYDQHPPVSIDNNHISHDFGFSELSEPRRVTTGDVSVVDREATARPSLPHTPYTPDPLVFDERLGGVYWPFPDS